MRLVPCSFAEFPHVIDVLLPFMCTYLPTWWSQGPDNADPTPSGSHVTMVTSEHLNSLLRLILKLIHKHVGDEKAEWMTGIAVYAQQIIVNVRYIFIYSSSNNRIIDSWSTHLVFQRRLVKGPSAASRRKVQKESGGHVSQGRIMQASFTLYVQIYENYS